MDISEPNNHYIELSLPQLKAQNYALNSIKNKEKETSLKKISVEKGSRNMIRSSSIYR